MGVQILHGIRSKEYLHADNNDDDDEHDDEDQNCHNSANFLARRSRFCILIDLHNI